MKPIYQLTVAGQPYRLINHTLQLELFSPGRGQLIVEAEQPLTGLVKMAIGYSPQPVTFFIGYVETSTTLDDKQQRLLVRELDAVLNQRLPQALRHHTLKEVLAAISGQTDLQFVVPPDADYANQPIPFYYHAGGGYYALDCLGAAFDIPQFIWQQQGDGRIYVGSWQHSDWPGRQLDIPARLLTNHTSYSGQLPMVPRLRPGAPATINGQQQVITGVTLTENMMTIDWTPDPWSGRLKRHGAA